MVSKKEHCQKMAEEKRTKTIDKVLKTLVELMHQGQTISLRVVIEKSGVSQSWLYKNPEIKQLIEYLEKYSLHPIKHLEEIKARLETIETMVKTRVH